VGDDGLGTPTSLGVNGRSTTDLSPQFGGSMLGGSRQFARKNSRDLHQMLNRLLRHFHSVASIGVSFLQQV